MLCLKRPILSVYSFICMTGIGVDIFNYSNSALGHLPNHRPAPVTTEADYINQVLQQSRFTIQDVNNNKLTSLIPDSNGNYLTPSSNSQYTNTQKYNANENRVAIGSILGGGYRV